MGKRQECSVKLLQLGFYEKAVAYFTNAVLHPDMRGAFPEEDLTKQELRKAVESIRDGEIAAWMPVVDDHPAGLITAKYMTPDLVTGTWGIFKPYRYASTKVLEAITAEIFERLKPRAIMVFVATSNRASYAGCWRAGFRPKGILSQHLLLNGERKDAYIMVKEASDGVGVV